MQSSHSTKLNFCRGLFLLLLLLHALTTRIIAQLTNNEGQKPEAIAVHEAGKALLAEIRAKAENGDAQSQFELGKAFYFGKLGLDTNQVEGVKWYRKAAEQNFAQAQYGLGFCYGEGKGVTKDYAEAVKWFRKAAEQNIAEAQFNLGRRYCTAKAWRRMRWRR